VKTVLLTWRCKCCSLSGDARRKDVNFEIIEPASKACLRDMLPEPHKISRRTLIKKAVLVAAGLGIASLSLGKGWRFIAGFKNSRARDILSRREHERPTDGVRWFVPAEYALVKVLSSIIIPSGINGPGAIEADVVGHIDRMVAASTNIKNVYGNGLAAFDLAAERQYGRIFTELNPSQQIELFALVEQASVVMNLDPSSLPLRAYRKVSFWYYFEWLGLRAAAELFDRLLLDTKVSFYTSKVAWDWLGYEGPPFPLGYIGRPSPCAVPLNATLS
jgi:hypothetical protein